MNKLIAAFTEHPASVGENYFQHMGMALGFSMRMMLCGLACLIHAFLPFLFVRVGRDTITRLHDALIVNRHRAARTGTATNDTLSGSSQSSH